MGTNYTYRLKVYAQNDDLEYSNAATVAGDAVYDTVHYIREGAASSNDGSDWENAYTELPASLKRGHTYFIADGIYPPFKKDMTGAVRANDSMDKGSF